VKKLIAAVYLRTGGSCSACGEPVETSRQKTLQTIRNRYEAETKGAEAYAAAAAAADDPQLRSLYTELAGDERRHGKELEALLKSMM
jgi:rubrerythrin